VRTGAAAGFDAAVAALFLPFETGAIAWPPAGDVAFLRARAGAWLHEPHADRILCEQGFKPFADALGRAGARIVAEIPAEPRYPLVLLLPPRQRSEARALFARALGHLEPGGILVAAQSNDEGARSGESDLERLAGPVLTLSRHKCRVYWSPAQARVIDPALLQEWLALDAPRPVGDGQWLSRPGLFAWDRIDAGSLLLASHLPSTLHGRVADLGAGWGWLASEVVRHCTDVAAIDLYEAERRALEPARLNLTRAVHESGRDIEVGVHWHDVAAGLPCRYDAIVSNPPFHQGRAGEPDLGRAFIASAADALEDGGAFWLVANQHLPYESILAARFARVREVVVQVGFKVIEASGPRR
jgi:16S rRNA (guanine1207-N2)-methyltransferase